MTSFLHFARTLFIDDGPSPRAQPPMLRAALGTAPDRAASSKPPSELHLLPYLRAAGRPHTCAHEARA